MQGHGHEVALGLLDGGEEASDGPAVRRGVGLGELEDLEAVLGDGDAHALEELVVEEGYVLSLELVVGEGEAVLVDQGRLEVGLGEPREPVHGGGGGGDEGGRNLVGYNGGRRRREETCGHGSVLEVAGKLSMSVALGS